jgi:hypothetical protein
MMTRAGSLLILDSSISSYSEIAILSSRRMIRSML